MSAENEATLTAAVKTLAHYFWVEQGWENFRAEFLANGNVEYERHHQSNAATIARMLDEISSRSPELKRLIMEARERL